MNLLATLWQLQQVDQEMDEKTKRAREVDAALAHDPVLSTSRATSEAAQKKLDAARSTMRDHELEAQSFDAKIKDLNERLYGGRVVNPKELDGLDKELQMVKRQRSAVDDKLLELMDVIEKAQQEVVEKTNALKQAETKRAGDLDHLTRERERITARLSALDAERAQTRATLDADPLRTYDRLRQTKAGRAVVQLMRDSCGACGVTVPTGLVNRVHTGDEIVFCSSCARILAP